MKGRRPAALLCVLLMHALFIFSLLELRPVRLESMTLADFESQPITLDLPPLLPDEEPAAPAALPSAPRESPSSPARVAPAAGESSAIAPPGYVDWPLEGKKAAARVLAREAEAERIAKMFAGPDGTWASLTRRERSRLSKFRWKPGIDGLEYDADGNQILHISEGCVIVNSSVIACALGKAKVHGDLFENMREYFDEQRLPLTEEGNGTEPESLRPPR